MDMGDPWLSGELSGKWSGESLSAACRERRLAAKAPDYSGAARALQIVRGSPPVARGFD
jgi:hypothetical protein